MANVIVGRFGAFDFEALTNAIATGRLLVRSGAVVRRIEVDTGGHVSGVAWFDVDAGYQQSADSKLIFLCASALESTRLLLLSDSPQVPGGIGARSGVLGRYLMDHIRVRAQGFGPPLFASRTDVEGRCLYLPRFDRREEMSTEAKRGFGIQLYHSFGDKELTHFSVACFGEMSPRAENRVSLHPSQIDTWGIPVLMIEAKHDAADLQLAAEEIASLRELAAALNFTITSIDLGPAPPGSANHECGTARMGMNPADSVLDQYNECWDARGLFVTDGACLPTQGIVNPTLTYLALTARACERALGQR